MAGFSAQRHLERPSIALRPQSPIILCCKTIRCRKKAEGKVPRLSRHCSACNRNSGAWVASRGSYIIITGLRPFITTTGKAPRELATLRGLFSCFAIYYLVRTINRRYNSSLPLSCRKQQCRYALLWCRYALDLVLASKGHCSGCRCGWEISKYGRTKRISWLPKLLQATVRNSRTVRVMTSGDGNGA